ncbi:hypothetical protein DFH09DRAFT_1086417 [Mycena vulgaris]|nr:hypothetical protein DFH09DRAFT_1086417 [Mycena vulgaris]
MPLAHIDPQYASGSWSRTRPAGYNYLSAVIKLSFLGLPVPWRRLIRPPAKAFPHATKVECASLPHPGSPTALLLLRRLILRSCRLSDQVLGSRQENMLFVTCHFTGTQSAFSILAGASSSDLKYLPCTQPQPSPLHRGSPIPTVIQPRARAPFCPVCLPPSVVLLAISRTRDIGDAYYCAAALIGSRQMLLAINYVPWEVKHQWDGLALEEYRGGGADSGGRCRLRSLQCPLTKYVLDWGGNQAVPWVLQKKCQVNPYTSLNCVPRRC